MTKHTHIKIVKRSIRIAGVVTPVYNLIAIYYAELHGTCRQNEMRRVIGACFNEAEAQQSLTVVAEHMGYEIIPN